MRAFLTLLAAFLLAVFLQMTVVSRIHILSGSADLVFVLLSAVSLNERARHMLVWAAALGWLMGVISAAPWYLFAAAYLGAVGLARLLARRIWQAPLLVLLLVTLVGSLLLQGFIFAYRALFEAALTLADVFPQVILPGLFLNLFTAILFHPLARDLTARLYPLEV